MEAAAVVTDYGDAVLIDKGLVHALNHDIKKLAREKIQILKEIRDFRKGIVMLQWENNRADMEAEDLVERTKEFQLLRVTKGLQDKNKMLKYAMKCVRLGDFDSMLAYRFEVELASEVRGARRAPTCHVRAGRTSE